MGASLLALAKSIHYWWSLHLSLNKLRNISESFTHNLSCLLQVYLSLFFPHNIIKID